MAATANGNGGMRKVALVRAWVITLMGAILIVYGLARGDVENVMLGFTVLGTEPMIRAGRAIK